MSSIKTIDSSIADRVQREKLAHQNDKVLETSYKLKNRFPHIWSYPSRRRLEAARLSLLGDIKNSTVLDYGCGWGSASMDYYNRGAIVTGIDVSEEYVQAAISSFKGAGCDMGRCRFLQMDAHALELQDDSFDFVVGDGILHHLQMDVALAELFRVLKPGGTIILFEPLADNPLLRLFRWLTPEARTKDERPLSADDLRFVSAMKAWDSRNYYCGVLEAPVSMLTSVVMPKNHDNWILRLIDPLERWLHKHDILLSWNQYVLLQLVKR